MKTEQIDVSLVICFYNAEAVFAPTLDSVTAQTLKNLEVICVNDGSPDRSVDICKAYARKDSRIRIVEHPKNKGLLAARKTGVKAARGKYLMFLDQDDFLLPEACSELAQLMDEKGCDIIQFNTDLVFESEEDRKTREESVRDFFSVKKYNALHSSDEILEACFLRREFPWNVWGKIYKINVARNVCSWVPDDKNILFPEDAYGFLVAASYANSMDFTRKAYYRYVLGPGVSAKTTQVKMEKCYDTYLSVIEPFGLKHSSKTVQMATRELGRIFRTNFFYMLITDMSQISKNVANIIQALGVKPAAQLFTEHWDVLAAHFLRCNVLERMGHYSGCYTDSKIRSVGVVCTDMVLTESFTALLDSLTGAGYEVDLYVSNNFASVVKDSYHRCKVTVLDENPDSRYMYLGSDKFCSKNDVYILSFGKDPMIETLEYLLLQLRIVSGKCVFAFLPEEFAELNLHYNLFLSASDGVLSSSSACGDLFGTQGILSGSLKEKSSQLKQLFNRFAAESGITEERKCMSRTASAAWKALGCTGERTKEAWSAVQKRRQEEAALLDQECTRLAAVPKDTDPFTLVAQSAYFDREWYLQTYPDVAQAGMDAAEHYFTTGWREFRNPSIHFDTFWYLKKWPFLQNGQTNPLFHFLTENIHTRKVPSCYECELSEEMYRLIRESGFFDDEYYRKQYPGVFIEDPISHFGSLGYTEMVSPSLVFNLKHFGASNFDVYQSGIDPLLHYLQYGIYESRHIYSPVYEIVSRSAFFDEAYYRAHHGGELGFWDPVSHYLLIGEDKGYLPSELFMPQAYKDFYLELFEFGLSLLYHFLRWGRFEGRASFPLKPREEYYFPEGVDQEAFWKRENKYLIVTHQLDFTGVPILCRMIAEIFQPEQNVAIVSPIDGPLRESCLKAGIPVFIDSDFFVNRARVSVYHEKGFASCLFNTLGLLRSYLRTADIIPSILWIHDNLTADFIPEKIREQVWFAPTVFATSGFTTKLVKTYVNRVRFLPYPVKDMGHGAKNGIPAKVRFGVFGVYSERKGQDVAIEAFKALPQNLKDKAELLLIGNKVLPEYFSKLEDLASGEANIHFVPAEKDPERYHDLYENLEVQICSSRTDPMPLVVFDGMMHGCVEILADTVGQKDFIKDEKNGYVFPSEDAEALRDCMIKILEQPEHFPALSAASRQIYLDHFEFTKASGEIRKVLDEIRTYF